MKLVSVIMPVHNGADYVKEAVLSIYNQTYSHFELIVVDDGSTDATMDIVFSIKDPRLVVIRNSQNLGLAASLNKAIEISKGDYIARMDADDISLHDRFQKQVSFLEQHPEVDVLGGTMKYFGYSGYLNHFPQDHETCKASLLFNVCFGHPAIMARKHIFHENKYRPEFLQYSEEYDLWCRLVFNFRFHNLPDTLVYYRTYPPRIKGEAERLRRQNSQIVRRSYITRLWPEVTNEELAAHMNISTMQPIHLKSQLKSIDAWLKKLLVLNQKSPAFIGIILNRVIAKRLFEYTYSLQHLGWSPLLYFYASDWRQYYSPPAKTWVKYGVKVALAKLQ
jgi:glycosyltransferase involved in cell wall biosynthesis